MSVRDGTGKPPGGGVAEGEFRAMLRQRLGQWQQRLQVPGPRANERAAIAREAADLRSMAQANAWWPLVQHLDVVQNLSTESAEALLGAVTALAHRLTPAASGAGPAAAPPINWGSPPNPASDRPLGARPMPEGPPMLSPSVAGNESVAMPSMLDIRNSPILPAQGIFHGPPAPRGIPQGTVKLEASPVAGVELRGSPPPRQPVGHDATLLSKPGLALPELPGQRGSPLPWERPIGASSVLPDSILKPAAAPKFLVKEGLLGLRPMGRPKSSDANPPRNEAPPEPSPALLGLQQRPAARSRTHVPDGSGGAPPKHASNPAHFGKWRPSSPVEPEVRGSREPRKAPNRIPVWFYAITGAVVFLVVGTVVVVTAFPPASPILAQDAGLRASHAIEASPAELRADPELAQAHSMGEESPQLHALIDEESRLVAKCKVDPSTCRKTWLHALDPIDAGILVAGPRQELPPGWVKVLHLKVPADFPLMDAPTLKTYFDYSVRNIAGRAQLQGWMFRCSAYAELFDATLERYGAPKWLKAVVFQESQCDPRAGSPVGAKGLWQFMPESARAYGLKVVEDEVDERLNPFKATEVGIRFLTDLKRKLGTWELALAAYNMGPYAISRRVAQVGGHADFWDLVRAGLLPSETAGYVPSIEAFGLILENAVELDFNGGGKRLDDSTEIATPAATRLSLIARAAHTSLARIRQLNLDFLTDVVPSVEAPTVRVPEVEAHRAQEFLKTHDPSDRTDTCVPEDFDWGANIFKGCPQPPK